MIKEYHVSENLFDKTTEIQAYYLDGTTGAYKLTSSTSRLALIPIEENTSYTFTAYSRTFRISFFDTQPVANQSPIEFYNRDYGVYGSHSNTFTSPIGAQYVAFFVYNSGTEASSYTEDEIFNTVMVNTGQTALPYEPYGNTWNTKSYCKATTGSETYSNLPIVVRSREQSISSWNMKGNEQHTGTASPTNPIEINGTGDRTANLYFKSLANCSIDATGTLIGNSQFVCYVAKVEANKTYIGEKGYVYAFFDTEPVSGSHSYNSQRVTENARDGITSPINGYVVVRFNTGTTDAMLSEGTTILPYEPYGYKIPISANGTALTPVYLTEPLMLISTYADSLASSGTVTRNIKKLVLDGTELWQFSSSDSNRTVCYINHSMSNVVGYCSHILWKSSYESSDYNRVVYLSSQGGLLYISLDNALLGGQTLQDFKTYLQQQYAAGTPVIVYYVLATPTTEQVTAPSIPTTSSPATIDVNTSVKPSEMSLTYDGYKICKPTKIVIPEPSEWIAKSWNGYNKMVGSSIWSDGDNIYYSMAMYQYVLNKSTSTWSDKTWNGLTSFNGANIWTDGDNVYYSFGDDQYVLNRQTSTWSAKTWKGLTSFDGGYVWTDGDNIYYSSSSNQYILDKATSTWVEKEWNGLTSFNGSSVWFEGNNIYYSYGLTRYVLNKSTSTWSEKVWTNAPYYMDGGRIWSVNGYTFYSNGTYEQYVLDKSTSTWSTKTWTGFTSFSGRNIWTDGTNIYVSDGNGKQYVLVR